MSPRLSITTAIALFLLAMPCLANPTFTVSDLGAADPVANYLNALTPTDQAAFQSGSFDVFAHPAQPGYLTSSHQDDIIRTNLSIGDTWVSVSVMATSNNKGVDVGYGTERLPQDSQFSQPMIAIFTPSPHSVIDPLTGRTIQSPGYLGALTPNQPNGFQGQVSGINDDGTIIGSSTQSGENVPFALVHTTDPYGGLAPTTLGSLGGKNGIPFALNNADQIVGWSEIADGTHHAFLLRQRDDGRSEYTGSVPAWRGPQQCRRDRRFREDSRLRGRSLGYNPGVSPHADLYPRAGYADPHRTHGLRPQCSAPCVHS